MLGEVHGDLARHDNLARVVLLFQLCDSHAELLGYGALNRLDRDLAHLRVDELLQALLGDGERNLHAVHAAPGDEANQRTFQLTHVRPDVGGNEHRYVGGQRGLLALRFLLQDRDFGLKIGRLNVCDQAPLESRAQAVFEVG